MKSRVLGCIGFAYGVSMLACAHHVPSAHTGMERVTLDASPCRGSCPAYRVSVSGDGNVAFEGRSRAVAHAHSLVDMEVARALIKRFSDSNFAALDSNYGQLSGHCTTSISEGPSYTLELNAANASHRVRFYGGCSPEGRTAEEEQARNDYRLLGSLAAEVYSVANVNQWLRQDPVR